MKRTTLFVLAVSTLVTVNQSAKSAPPPADPGWPRQRTNEKGTLVYYVFDLLSLDGKDLRPLPLVKRKQRLGRFLTGRHPRLFEVEHIEKDGVAMFAGAMALGLEGIVAKDAKSPYVEGPAVTGHWQKIKNSDYKRQGKVDGNLVGGKAVGRTVL